jgi:thiol-disulfide isomerase/thioredoxin
MSKICTSLIALILIFNVNVFSQSTAKKADNGLVWYTNLQEVHELSAKTNKPIFAFFTGSDWCGWCKKLQNNVFVKPEFIDWASKNVILLELDFPRAKPLAPELSKQNAELQQALGVRGYPTVWLMYTEKVESTNSINLNTLGSLGYPQGAEPGKEQVKFLSDAAQVMANKKK